MQKSEHTAWVVIPAYNEEKYLERVIKKIQKVTKQFIIVDDGSHDATTQIAGKFTPHVVTHHLNLGKGAALKTGCIYAFDHLKADSVIFFDADDQHDPQLIPQFEAALEHHGAVFGVRAFDTKMPLTRIFLNRLASVLILLLFGRYVPDIPCGFKGLRKEAFYKINWKATDYAVEMEIAARVAQYHIAFSEVSVPTVYHDLDRGMNFLDTLTIIGQLLSWRLFS